MRKIETEKLKTVHERISKYPHKLQIISLVILAVLMCLPFGMDKMNLLNYEQTPQLLYPFTALSSGLVQKDFHFFYCDGEWICRHRLFPKCNFQVSFFFYTIL